MSERHLQVNGHPRRTDAGTVSQLLDELGLPPDVRGVAVAVNGEVVPRGNWHRVELKAEDRVEVVGAVQGG